MLSHGTVLRLVVARRSEVATEPWLAVPSDVGLGLGGKTGGRR